MLQNLRAQRSHMLLRVKDWGAQGENQEQRRKINVYYLLQMTSNNFVLTLTRGH